MYILPEKLPKTQRTQSKTIPSLAFQVSPNPAVPTISPSFPKLSRQTNSGKELSPNKKMASASHISRSGHGRAIRRRPTILCLIHISQCSHFRSGTHRSPRLQDQLSTETSSRSFDTCPSRPQCRTLGRPTPDKWRLVPQDRSGDCYAVCRSTPGISEDVCQDVR